MAKHKKQTNPKRQAKTAQRRAVQASKRQAASRRAKKRTTDQVQIATALMILQAKIDAEGESAAPTPPLAPLEVNNNVDVDTAIGSYLATLQPTAIRQFYGGATKFLLQRQNWADEPPSCRVDHHPKVRPIRNGFRVWTEWPAEQSHPDRELLDAMRRAAGRNIGQNLTTREAREGLGRLLRVMRGWCRRYIAGPRPEGGLAAFYLTVKRTYYPKGAPAAGRDVAMSRAERAL